MKNEFIKNYSEKNKANSDIEVNLKDLYIFNYFGTMYSKYKLLKRIRIKVYKFFSSNIRSIINWACEINQ